MMDRTEPRCDRLMPLFADAFLKWPNVYDILSVLGLGLAIWSIRQAQRDIRSRIRDARRELLAQVERLARVRQLADLRHHLELMREAAAGASWKRASAYADTACSDIARVRVDGFSPLDRTRWNAAADDIRELARDCVGRKENTARLDGEAFVRLQRVITFVGELEAAVQLVTPEGT